MVQRFWRSPSRLLLGAAVAGMVAVTSPAVAQPSAAAINGDLNEQASVLYKAGVDAAQASRMPEARAFLLGAWRIKQHWQIAANLGDTEFSLGRYRDAAEHLEYFLRTATSITEDERKSGQEMLAKAKAKVGTLMIRVTTPGAEVLVNGALIGKSPLVAPVFVDPGRAMLEARLEGYAPGSVTAELAAGSEKSVELKLERVEVAVTEPTGGPCPLKKADAPGSGGPAQCSERPRRTALYVGLGLGAAGLVAGGVAWGVARQTYATDKKASERAVNAAAISAGAGLALMGGGIVVHLLSGSDSNAKQGVDVGLHVGPGAGAAMVRGTW
jgi:hypothetical protein